MSLEEPAGLLRCGWLDLPSSSWLGPLLLSGDRSRPNMIRGRDAEAGRLWCTVRAAVRRTPIGLGFA
jgi:hypothetical protein